MGLLTLTQKGGLHIYLIKKEGLAETDQGFSWGVDQHINASGKNGEGKNAKWECGGGASHPPLGSITGLEDRH